MKRRFGFLSLLIALVLIAVLAGCRADNGTGEKGTKTEEPGLTQQPAETPQTSAEPSQKPEESGKAPEQKDQENAFNELKALLPQKEGYKWVYNGYAEYGHDLVLKEIRTEDDKLVYEGDGEVFDMSDGASGRDYSLSVSFTVTPQSIVQDKTGDMMMDTFDHMVLLQAPLKEGASWTQTVKKEDGTEITLDCTIEKVEEESGSKVYTVSYQDKNGPFYENRTIREGTGVISFLKLYITDEGNYELGYSLYEDASGYNK